ncbi:hypothetical protein SNEBB_002915 [Seison nebaliae]|nr:hypothetical protein SNEBB_002915 [Seison nebaliae]
MNLSFQHKSLTDIEQQIVRSKQKERELKRYETGLKRERLEVRVNERNEENKFNKEKYNAEKDLINKLLLRKELKDEFYKEQNKNTEKRLKEGRMQVIKTKQINNTNQNNETLIEMNYSNKLNEMKLAESQRNLLEAEYKQKIEKQDTIISSLKQEVKNCELLRRKKQLEKEITAEFEKKKIDESQKKLIKEDLLDEGNFEKNMKSTNKFISQHIQKKRLLSADHNGKFNNNTMKQRELERKQIDAKNNISSTWQRQRGLRESSDMINQDIRRTQSQEFLNIHNERKRLRSEEAYNQMISSRRNNEKIHLAKSVQHQRNMDRQQNLEFKNRYDQVVKRGQRRELDVYLSLKDLTKKHKLVSKQFNEVQNELLMKETLMNNEINNVIRKYNCDEQLLSRKSDRIQSEIILTKMKKDDTLNKLLKVQNLNRNDRSLLTKFVQEEERLKKIL